MPVIKPEDMRNAVAAGNRLLGFDLGSKTIGLALTDTGWTVASPLKTLRRGKFRDNAFSMSIENGYTHTGGTNA